MNYRVMLSGSPAEPVAMATHSGYGPLREGAQRTTAQHHGKQQRVWASAVCISGSILRTDAFSPPPLAVVEGVQSSSTFQNRRHFPVSFPTPTALHHPECLSKPIFPNKARGRSMCSSQRAYSVLLYLTWKLECGFTKLPGSITFTLRCESSGHVSVLFVFILQPPRQSASCGGEGLHV